MTPSLIIATSQSINLTCSGLCVVKTIVFPFSFKECKQYFENLNSDEVFDFYVKNGGMAGSYVYKNQGCHRSEG